MLGLLYCLLLAAMIGIPAGLIVGIVENWAVCKRNVDSVKARKWAHIAIGAISIISVLILAVLIYFHNRSS